MLKINIKDIGTKKIDIGSIEGSQEAIKISKLNLNTVECQENALNIPVIPANAFPSGVKVAFLPLSARFSAIKKIDFAGSDLNTLQRGMLYQYCDMCNFETPHSQVKSGDTKTKVSCNRCHHGYEIGG
jgi:hypothetical protein